jgi:hypothetical protein
MGKTIALLCAVGVSLAVALPFATAGTRTQSLAGAGRCTVDGNQVSAAGLPTNAVVNFFVTDADGKKGWVLGITWEGTWSLTVPDRTGPTKYEFASTTYGKNGSKYLVYASCSAS